MYATRQEGSLAVWVAAAVGMRVRMAAMSTRNGVRRQELGTISYVHLLVEYF